ncbi:unnamed protein product [Pedinophyceae sp. YPF-701]|nr:unnamed protein product [Pedinophyceae sp. YPF-701]
MRTRALQPYAPGASVRERFACEDAYEMEVLHCAPSSGSPERPPLVFVHGSYHAAWVWDVFFHRYFAERGYDCYALSLRGQGSSDPVSGPVGGTLRSHARDVADFCRKRLDGRAPVLVGHSFGGLVVQEYVMHAAGEGSAAASGDVYPALSGLVLLNTVPPSGNQGMIGRFLRKDFLKSARITWAFISKSFLKSSDTCKELFFSETMPEPDVRRYMELLENSSQVRLLDLRRLSEDVPLPRPPPGAPPVLVVGGADDNVVDLEAVEETGAHFQRSTTVVLEGVAHDSMIDVRWEDTAKAVEEWLAALR